MSAEATCWQCGKTYDPPDPIERQSECPHCNAWLRVCRNCEFYDPQAHNACHEPMAQLQADKEVANACDYFRPATEITVGPKKSKKDINDLFRDS